MMNQTVTFELSSIEDTQKIAEALAPLLQPADLILLNGELGAGKTTFTRCLGQGLGVRDGIISPTFVLSRVHPNLPDGIRPGGPDLVHVDAYRLSSAEEIDDLDLEYSLERSVTVVEWGEHKVEHLSDSRLEIDIIRATGGDGEIPFQQTSSDDDADEHSSEPRTMMIRGYGPRWDSTNWNAIMQALSAVLNAQQ
ncbi:tRNA (adenosine(37)-N6)-threonylcarbamoyltransferase complex ATPase subunit type 1 TsaE [Rothia sp. P6271]|uniref:tRNA (adenosine(37)-N6)-threonylcarbamoyltransferase complex ATPase subunit type 1 TsaE n=1 Tax=unclassified Rothia (in: high G+C Gram-positive bacteria) TaxID=2689056 RepID=UPI003AD000B4